MATKRVMIVYWSGTGNTKAMAQAIGEGAAQLGPEVRIVPVDQASKADVLGADVLALGCPAMGNEVLEEAEMEPFIKSLEGETAAKQVTLFGSYGWGDGQWLRDWSERMGKMGFTVIGELAVPNEPDEAALAKCRELGKKLAADS